MGRSNKYLFISFEYEETNEMARGMSKSVGSEVLAFRVCCGLGIKTVTDSSPPLSCVKSIMEIVER